MQVAIHLVGGNMVEAECRLARRIQLRSSKLRVASSKCVGADDIGLDERGRGTVDGAIDMRLGRQVHDRVRLKLGSGPG